MKLNLNRIGAFFVGVGSAAAIFASTSAAHAATFNWSFDGLANTGGTFTANNGVIDSLTGTVGGVQISGLLSRESFSFNDNLIPLTVRGVSFTDLYQASWNLYKNEEELFSLFYYYTDPNNGGSTERLYEGNFSYSEVVSVPTTTVPEPGATIPVAVVSLIALGALKSRKRTALKTTIANPVISVN